ncbi:sulfite exporter TauE/SafE family protein [Pseudochryseolinea flava]|uniref:Urease accessory protein UreH-like transmembrane domain-containing protein n=1 Tax=Pseudochryseolinea flava TaxID=2059302 RepID=A0A364Y6F6_9BACT|nr:sulfite exporter TauE/SafE family protein [Pseudochryseolinea flava]RAW02385.1 hypothetical protein DQQ10_07585 [Pseudochryseolinea flava]
MFVTALIMGFTGSLHCISMCSPLSMAVTNGSRRILITKLTYNLGRILTYGLLGGVIGTFGWLLPFSTFQHTFSIVLGILLLTTAIVGMNNVQVPLISKTLGKLSLMLKTTFSAVLKRKNTFTTLLLGALNGLLPCGLTFIALTFSSTLGNPISSATFMIIFGLGTLPAMIGAAGMLQFLVRRFHLNLRKVTTAMLVISGCLLIARVLMVHEHHTKQHLGEDIVVCGR